MRRRDLGWSRTSPPTCLARRSPDGRRPPPGARLERSSPPRPITPPPSELSSLQERPPLESSSRRQDTRRELAGIRSVDDESAGSSAPLPDVRQPSSLSRRFSPRAATSVSRPATRSAPASTSRHALGHAFPAFPAVGGERHLTAAFLSPSSVAGPRLLPLDEVEAAPDERHLALFLDRSAESAGGAMGWSHITDHGVPTPLRPSACARGRSACLAVVRERRRHDASGFRGGPARTIRPAGEI